MAEKTHEALVGDQFGARAEAYLTSTVHARGADLDALAAVAAGHAGARVLDLGCGGGHVTFRVAPLAGEVVACDLSGDMLDVVARTAAERGMANVTTRRARAEDLPFDAGSFDLVLSRFSAHHWRDLDAALREAARVLRPGGTVAIVDTVAPGDPLADTFLQAIELLRDCSHVRDYSRAEWEAAFARARFSHGSSQSFRVRLDFRSWVERIATPQPFADAIRLLQESVSAAVIRHFETEPDGSFHIDVALFRAEKAGR